MSRRRLAHRPLAQVERVIAQARLRPGVRDPAAWVVSALRALPADKAPASDAPPRGRGAEAERHAPGPHILSGCSTNVGPGVARPGGRATLVGAVGTTTRRSC